MASSRGIRHAIIAWGLEDGGGHIAARWTPPESFLESTAPAAKGPPSVGGPPLTAEEIDLLRVAGSLGPEFTEQIVALLRRARRTWGELDAARAVLGSASAGLPEALRIECAYLLVVNGLGKQALQLLDGAVLAPADLAPRLTVGEGYVARHVFEFQPDARPISSPASEDDVARLALFGSAGGPSVDEVLAVLHATRGTGQGVRALRATLDARANGALPESVRTLCAERLVELGDHERGRALLADGPASPPASPVLPGIDVDAPVRERDAAARAIAAERVLATDMDRLGVRERHGRFAAMARAAQLTVDALRGRGSPRADPGAMHSASRALERVGEAGRAAEIAALGGDQNEAARLGVPAKTPPPADAEAGAVLREIDALDRRGLRLVAAGVARAFLEEHPDVEVAAFARGVLARLVRGPLITLAIDGNEERILLGDEVTIGRVEATIAIASPLMSRAHLRIHRPSGAAVVEDLRSHNGTWLAGARIAGPLPIGAGVDLSIAQQIPCAIRPLDGAMRGAIAMVITLAGERWIASLGPLDIAGVRLALEARDGKAVVTLCAGEGIAASLGDVPIETTIELARGDVVRVNGTTPLELRVIG